MSERSLNAICHSLCVVASFAFSVASHHHRQPSSSQEPEMQSESVSSGRAAGCELQLCQPPPSDHLNALANLFDSPTAALHNESRCSDCTTTHTHSQLRNSLCRLGRRSLCNSVVRLPLDIVVWPQVWPKILESGPAGGRVERMLWLMKMMRGYSVCVIVMNMTITGKRKRALPVDWWPTTAATSRA